MKQTITKTTRMPQPFAPYSFATVGEGKHLFVSGLGPYDPESKKFVRNSIREQTRLTLLNLKSVLEAANATLDNVLSVRVFLQPLDEESFSAMNEVYLEFFGQENLPARTTIGATLLKIDVEIDCVCLLPKS